MSAVHALNGYRDAKVKEMNRQVRRETLRSKLALAAEAIKDWFDYPIFWDLYEAQRMQASAAEMNKIFEKWGR